MTTVLQRQRTDRPVQAPARRRDPGRFRTTPGRLRLLSILSVGAILVLLVVSAGALSSRRGAARSVGNDSGPLLVQVQALYRALADADAMSTRQLLAAGQPPAEVRQRYRNDIDDASRLAARIAERVESDPKARRAIQVVAAQIPFFAEKVEAGRVNSRAGQPLGAEMTRQASALMRTAILPATLDLYEVAANDLHDDYERGTSASQMVWIVVIGVATLVALIVTQIYAAQRTNRVFNVGLVAASVIVAVMLVWSLVQFNKEQNSLVTAQRDGSDTVQVLSSARILALKAQANANLGLAERGTGDLYRAAYQQQVKTLCGGAQCHGGLLGYARTLAARTNTEAQIDAIQRDAASYQDVVEQVVARDDEAKYADAVRVALKEQVDASEALDSSIKAERRAAQARFADAANEAQVGFAVLAVALTLGLLLAAALVLVGLQPRIGEYR